MSPPSISLIEDLSPSEIEQLTQLLVLSPMTAPGPAWLQEQADFIPSLRPKLKRSASLASRLAMSLPFGTQKAHLCPSHKPLNPYLIRRIFLQVSGECTTRLTRLAENPYLPGELAIHIRVLQTANSLWMSPDLFRVTFQCQPEEERYERIASDCEACILAAVGGNIRILKELRTSMLGRKKKRGKGARLLPLVEGWIEWTGTESVVRAQSDDLARRVRDCRRQMQLARRQMRRNLADTIDDSAATEGEGINHHHSAVTDHSALTDDMDEPLLKDDAAAQAAEHYDHDEQEHDPEESILDYYANRISTTSQAFDNHAPDGTSIHPAFRQSLVFQFQTNSSASTIGNTALPSRTRSSSASTLRKDALPTRASSSSARTARNNALPARSRSSTASTVPSTVRKSPPPSRPSNPTPYSDRGGGGASASASASASATPTPRAHQPPPLAYHNRSAQKQQKWRKTAYSESAYSRDESGRSHFAPSSTRLSSRTTSSLPDPQQKPGRARSAGQQAGEYQASLAQRSMDIEEEEEPEEGRKDESGRRDTMVTRFSDFI